MLPFSPTMLSVISTLADASDRVSCFFSRPFSCCRKNIKDDRPVRTENLSSSISRAVSIPSVSNSVRKATTCWNQHEVIVSPGFCPKEFHERLVLTRLQNLENFSPVTASAFDRQVLLITMIQFKQWDLVAFNSLCRKYEPKFEAIRLYDSAQYLKRRVLFIHGTNSAILPCLRQLDQRLRCSGDLLANGIAPMSGEIDRGGLRIGGVSQCSISGASIHEIPTCWGYATKISHSFRPDRYNETFFLEILDHLERYSPFSMDWDQFVVEMTRFKQWNFSVFSSFCKKYADRIEAIKTGSKILPPEQRVLRALEYDSTRLKAAKTNSELRSAIIKELGFAGGLESWLDFLWTHPMSSTPNLDPHRNKFDEPVLSQEKADCMIQDIICLKLLDKIDETRMSETTEWCPSRLVREVMEKRSKEGTEVVRQRLQPFRLLFDPRHRPLRFCTRQDKTHLMHPFPILLGSTKVAGTSSKVYRSIERYLGSGAQLGEEIDIVVVRKENYPAMSKWLFKQGLAGKVRLYPAEVLNILRAKELS